MKPAQFVSRILSGWLPKAKAAAAPRPCATWSIAATCSEPRRLIEYFVAHHLSIGAEHIYLFFDDPADGCAAYFKDIPKVTTFACDKAYWRRRAPTAKGRPIHCTRQVMNVNYVAKKLCQSDWLFHIDADELIYPRGDKSVGEILAESPDDYIAVSLPPAERMFEQPPAFDDLSMDGLFKLRPGGPQAKFGEQLYGKLGSLFSFGFQGHTQGKCAKRVSADMGKINIHFVRKDRKVLPHYKISEADAVLLHYFPLSFEDWRHKFERRVLDEDFFNSMNEEAQNKYGIYKDYLAKGQAGLTELFSTLSIMSPTDPILKKRPYLFTRVSLGLDRKVADLVTPFARPDPFDFVSAPDAAPVPPEKKIFQIGMDQDCASDLCAFLGRSGLSYAYHDDETLNTGLAQAKKQPTAPLAQFAHHQVIAGFVPSALGDPLDLAFLFKAFPKAAYILNSQPIEDWIAARLARDDGAYLEAWKTHLQTQDTQTVIQRWTQDWEDHRQTVQAAAARDGLRVIPFSATTSKPRMLLEHLQSLGVA